MIALVRRNSSLHLFLRTPPLREISTSAAAVYDVLVNKHDFSPEIAASVSSKLSRFRSPERADSILTFLKQNSFSTTQLQRLVRSDPRILTASAEAAVKLKISIFRDFGFPPEETAKIMSSNNAIIHSSAEKKIIPQLSTLKALLGSNSEVVDLVKRSVWHMTVDLEKLFIPNVDFLKNCGVKMEGIRILLRHFPRCLLLKPELMREAVEKAREMGVDENTKTFVYAVRAIASFRKESWEAKIQGFRDLGVSDSEVVEIFRRSPLVICTSLEKCREIKRLLLGTGRFETADLISDPPTFLCSVERRYKPRLEVLEVLESKGLIKRWPKLSLICRWTDERFFGAFVRPYADQLGEGFVEKYFASREKQ
ncbi:uncharacterized protein LOC125221122 [Salvia hispanica]|uniref:uncharacterized protein LOC125221122 n=1 Tax=Salvia hispanica TaxID=49212 RepID=UPI0020095ADD|nr:uncharacterized protein LOC125221122 [Salvia hispanica]XP_047979211.1 uncharacterized protein LOC125221122 [Salvia hispanica]XP_047979217.1 uncharacterized protein LOC125221122 [Salvia hispanica]XP_047979225.1 uncharacterized protein LOC125221122 [Salvia hispanica]XP_047979232.1 uncharacterized protein LOC125221122 [Salvia hispanica]